MRMIFGKEIGGYLKECSNFACEINLRRFNSEPLVIVTNSY